MKVQIDAGGEIRVTSTNPGGAVATNPLTLAFPAPSLNGLTLATTTACTAIPNPGITGNTIAFQVATAPACTDAVFQLQDPVCFPASSTLRRLLKPSAAANEPEAWQTVAMPDLRVGDTVECLARDPVFGANSATSAAYGRLGHCTVFGYKKALPAAAAAPYTRITYEEPAGAHDDQAGAVTKAGSVTMSANHHLLDPLTGQAREAGSLRPGDAVLRATPSGAFVPARVRSVAGVREGGAYVPLLSGGGLPVVDGVVAYPSSGDSDVGLDAKHWGQFYLHAPLWQGADGTQASFPGAGRTLGELGAQAPVAAFTQKWHAVREAAAREGRATCDWAAVAADMHEAITGQGKLYTEAEALAVLDKHHRKAAPRGMAEA